jgi:hypothetical protein
MDSSLAFYKQCVKKLLSQYELLKDKDSAIELIFDDERMRYIALWIGCMSMSEFINVQYISILSAM